MAATLTYSHESTPNAQPFSVEGKRAIVTGAGSGINLSFAEILLSRGCSVLFADKALRPEAQKLVDQYAEPKEGQPRAIYQETDVRDWLQLERMFEVADREFGGVDIVCPGAGIYDPHCKTCALNRQTCIIINKYHRDQLLASARIREIKRCTRRKLLRQHRHQCHAPHPDHTARPLPLPEPQELRGQSQPNESQARGHHQQHRGPDVKPPHAHLRGR